MAKKKAQEPSDNKMPFGISQAAEELGITETHARVKMRNAKIKKAGKSYQWPSKAAMQADLKRVKAA